MIKLENYEVVGWEHAIRGMRNPMNSWNKSDSGWDAALKDSFYHRIEPKKYILSVQCDGEYEYDIGPDDANLMMNLSKAGTDHRKFMRMITVYVDILAPLYWWKEFDTYKVGTVANSCSTMHKICDKPFTIEDFSCEHLVDDNDTAGVIQRGICTGLYSPLFSLELIISVLNANRKAYLETKDKKYWWQIIQLLPSSYNQKRTIMMNYEVLANIYKSRKNHKLDEWVEFCKWIETLPYSELITGDRKDEKIIQ